LAGALALLCAAAFGWHEGKKDTQEAAAPGLAVQTDTDTKRIALTFDDGPHSVYTEQLLDGLAERNVKATFFLLGENIEGREDIVKRIQEEGHLIGSHTYYHVDISRLEQEEACLEIERAVEAVTDITGEEVEYIRPPFGNWNRELESSVCMIPVFWSLDTRDWMTRNADQIVQKVVTDVEENDIILMHDSYDSTVKAALRVIDLLQAQGYEFVTADQLILE
jgi:peptidoglycan/xylan/chitin deacetylase (PgdA/CDA1 family)